MAASLRRATPGPRPGRRLPAGGRLAALLAVLALHGIGLAALLAVRPAPAAVAVAPVVLEARLIRQAPALAPLPPPPAEPLRPKARPSLIASARPAPAPMLAPPPMPKAEPVAEPVEIAEAAPPAPATAAPAAEPAVVPPSFVAAYLNNPAPRYPQAAKQRRESGEVRLRVRVMTDGSAGDVQIERSSGSTALDQAARDVVFRQWRFVPARRGDEAVEAWVIVPIVFALR